MPTVPGQRSVLCRRQGKPCLCHTDWKKKRELGRMGHCNLTHMTKKLECTWRCHVQGFQPGRKISHMKFYNSLSYRCSWYKREQKHFRFVRETECLLVSLFSGGEVSVSGTHWYLLRRAVRGLRWSPWVVSLLVGILTHKEIAWSWKPWMCVNVWYVKKIWIEKK